MQWLDHIRKRKKEYGYTNETLSEKSGISVGTLNKLLSGATADPKLSTLLALANTFHCTIDELLGTGKNERVSVPDDLAEKYAELDEDGLEAVSYIINKEYTRMLKERASTPYSLDIPVTRRIRLYDTPASAGTGSYLFGDQFSEITIYTNSKTESADFAVRVYGDSMMPRFENGDILLVEGADEISKGELGIFSVNGESYFKKYGGNSLISLNPMYADIRLTDNDRVLCFGRVIGKLKK
ncbi:MAG: helix-turn-helix domain-containing protein [Clostridia bacterium]|nr:helix-turn-helix domain-containing protein [Clostridia bacterium]MBR6745438.1 helix-turn-helix domain-containing protein [Clostridia bacterium]